MILGFATLEELAVGPLLVQQHISQHVAGMRPVTEIQGIHEVKKGHIW